MSREAMQWAMERFQQDSAFRDRVRNSPDKAAIVSRALQEEMTRTAQADPDRYRLTDDERRTINGQEWDKESDQDMIDKIGKAGCSYT